MASEQKKRVVIIGAGFGGLAAARALSKADVDVLLVDRNNYHTFLPLLYQVAAAELEATQIGYPVRSVLRKFRNTRFLMAEVVGLDSEQRIVETNLFPVLYDYLILAAGSMPHYFGVEGAQEHAFPLYSLAHGVALRTQILRCFERASHEPNEEKRRQMLTFAVVGGGPTGVEFVGALAELIRGPLAKDYPNLDLQEFRIVLLEALDSVLSMLPEKLRRYTQRRLQRMGVEVCLNAAVTRITPEAVHLKDGSVLPAETVVWTAGVRADPRVQSWGLPTGRSGRVPVLPSLQVEGYPEIYVVGDLAYLEQEGRPVPMLAAVASRQGRAAGQNVVRQLSGEEPQPYRYRDGGSMVTIGRNAGVARLKNWAFTGFFAWAAWLAVHIYLLIGFRNRVLVLINWAWDYLFFERGVRLIMPRGEKSGTAQPPS
jgi:NADH dehydrogenase